MQLALEQRYDVHIDCQVEHFVSHDNALVEHVTGEKNHAPELLLVREDAGNLDVTLFLQKSLIDSYERCKNDKNSEPRFRDSCTILEGISHFVYLVWNAQHGRQIKPIEMELQAEVDKFVFNALDQPAAEQQRDHRQLQDNLFRDVAYTHSPGTQLHHRYRIANEYAQLYCSWLSKQYRLTQQNVGLYAELARFYRMGAAAKFNHIKLATR